jgi:CBS domain containing-hemolysin-like protein
MGFVRLLVVIAFIANVVWSWSDVKRIRGASLSSRCSGTSFALLLYLLIISHFLFEGTNIVLKTSSDAIYNTDKSVVIAATQDNNGRKGTNILINLFGSFKNKFRWSSKLTDSITPILRKNIPLVVLYNLIAILVGSYKVAASGGVGGAVIKTNLTPIQGFSIWGVLFVLSATLHSAESAITKISPWKVQEFAEEEGANSPFATLSTNLTRLLSTILLTTTACSIYSTALFVATAEQAFPTASLGLITATLTAVTLFFGELLPKALAVSNSELVARKLVPIISKVAYTLTPITATITFCSEVFLQLIGMRSVEDRNVSEDMLRMVVDEAQRTEGIETGEGRMIKAVLDMQDKEVNKIMQPRVDITAVSESTCATDILKIAINTKYTRIPVYRGDVDNIIGVLFVKDLLDYMTLPTDESYITNCKFRPQMKESWGTLNAGQLMEPTYFIPETMTTWNALQEMRRRRLHMAIVVDEFGGTSGLVTFEDLLEEVVGEIYDEDDEEEQVMDTRSIFKGIDGTFEMKGYAELDDVCEALDMKLDDELLDGEYSTIGGLLCSIAGQIPKAGDSIYLGSYRFIINEVEDEKRILTLSALSESVGSATGNQSSSGPSVSAVDNVEANGANDNVDASNNSENNGSSDNRVRSVFKDGAWNDVAS